jgi:hypothetical protein
MEPRTVVEAVIPCVVAIGAGLTCAAAGISKQASTPPEPTTVAAALILIGAAPLR